MLTIVQSERFLRWLKSLRDIRARARILERLDRVSQGNLGDAAAVGDGVSELRIHYGPGYRIYFMRRVTTVVICYAAATRALRKKPSQWRDRWQLNWRIDP